MSEKIRCGLIDDYCDAPRPYHIGCCAVASVYRDPCRHAQKFLECHALQRAKPGQTVHFSTHGQDTVEARVGKHVFRVKRGVSSEKKK